jgi:uncharacterized RDD family membrane protein YckC
VSFPAGWYDDPQDPTQQRYWDGSVWTDQRRAQQGPPPHQGQFGQPAQHGQVYGGAQPGPVAQYGQPPAVPQQGYQPYPQQSQGGYPPQSQGGYPPQGYGYPGQAVHTTPDGQPLSGWWRRVGARILDSIIVGLISLPFTGYFYYKYFQVIFNQDLFTQPQPGEPPKVSFSVPSEAYKWMVPAILIGILVAFVYEYLFLTKKGATLGKMAVGIKVRLRDVPGNPPPIAVLKRYGFEVAVGVLGIIPLVGTLVGFIGLLDYLWPLWDDKKQALHDKIAGTNVVRTP